MNRYKFLLVMLAMGTLLFTSCKKDNDDKEVSNNWDLIVTVDLNGAFDVSAEAEIIIKGETFTADVNTKMIGGIEEVHQISISGAVEDGNKLVVNDYSFQIDVNGVSEIITLMGTLIMNENDLSGSGDVLSVITGMDPVQGTFTITGTRKE